MVTAFWGNPVAGEEGGRTYLCKPFARTNFQPRDSINY